MLKVPLWINKYPVGVTEPGGFTARTVGKVTNRLLSCQIEGVKCWTIDQGCHVSIARLVLAFDKTAIEPLTCDGDQALKEGSVRKPPSEDSGPGY